MGLWSMNLQDLCFIICGMEQMLKNIYPFCRGVFIKCIYIYMIYSRGSMYVIVAFILVDLYGK